MKRLSAALGILGLILVTFSPVLKASFLNLDDNAYVTANDKIKSINAKSMAIIFSQPHLGQYCPLVLLSYALENHFFGMDPAIFHGTNLVLHILNTLLMFWFIRKLTGDFSVALWTALLFALHPTRAEPVSWVSSRKDLLYVFFALLSWIQYLRYRERPEWGRLASSIASFIASFFCKPMAVSVPLVIWLYERVYRCEKKWITRRETIYFFIMTVMVVIGLAAHPAASATRIGEVPPLIKMANIFYSPLFYLGKIFWPADLAALYTRPEHAVGSLPFVYLFSPLLCLALVAMVFWSIRKSRHALFGVGFFFAVTLPVLPFFRISQVIVADRYIYLSAAGIFLAVTHSFFSFKSGAVSKSLKFMLIIALLVSCVGTYRLCLTWENNLSLFDRVIEKYPTMAFAYLKRGDDRFAEKDYVAAINDYSKTIALRPEVADGYHNRAVAYFYSGQRERALHDIEMAVALDKSRTASISKTRELITSSLLTTISADR